MQSRLNEQQLSVRRVAQKRVLSLVAQPHTWGAAMQWYRSVQHVVKKLDMKEATTLT